MNVAVGKCLMLTPDGKGGILARRMWIHELMKWLRNFAEALHGRPEQSRLIGSHSSKVTLLSWAEQIWGRQKRQAHAWLSC